MMGVIFLTHYISAGLIAMGYLFESLFSIDYYIGISVASLVVLIYTLIGGFITVAWTDFFQAIFLLLVIILVPAVAFFQIDGIKSIEIAAEQKEISLAFISDYSIDTLLTIFSLALGWGLGYFGQPHIITKFMGINSASELYKSKYIGISWQIITLLAAAVIGLIGIAFFKEGLANPELVFVEMVKQLFNPWMIGFILCGVIAANMSTMDSQILVCASILSEDLYKKFAKRNSSSDLLRVSRYGVLAVSLASLAIAWNKSSTVLDTVLYSWSGLGSSFGPLVLMSLYSETTNRYGAIAGIIVGGLVSGFWPLLNPMITEYTMFPMIPGFFFSLVAIYLVSKLTGGSTAKKLTGAQT
jgi:sodium/proline symporter